MSGATTQAATQTNIETRGTREMFKHVQTCEPDMFKHAEPGPLFKVSKTPIMFKCLNSNRVWPIPADPCGLTIEVEAPLLEEHLCASAPRAVRLQGLAGVVHVCQGTNHCDSMCWKGVCARLCQHEALLDNVVRRQHISPDSLDARDTHRLVSRHIRIGGPEAEASLDVKGVFPRVLKVSLQDVSASLHLDEEAVW